MVLYYLGLIGRVPLQLLRVGDIPLQLLIFEICYSHTSFNTLTPPAGYVSLLLFRMDRITLRSSHPVRRVNCRPRPCRAGAQAPAARAQRPLMRGAGHCRAQAKVLPPTGQSFAARGTRLEHVKGIVNKHQQ